jgi:hypothetical protein
MQMESNVPQPGKIDPPKRTKRRNTCVMCDELIEEWDAWAPLNSQQYAHHECSLRMALGGIGHQIAHEYWCQQMHDPDAGLTYRQSAKMVRALVDVLGIEEVAKRGVTT